MIFDLFYNQFTLLAQPSLPTLSAKYPRVSVRDFSFLAPFPTVFRPNRTSTQVSFELKLTASGAPFDRRNSTL